MSKYKKMINDCFSGLDTDLIDRTLCISLKYEERFPMVLHFRE